MDTSNEAYTNLITSQYQSSANYLTWLEAVLQKFKDVSDLADVMYTYFDLDTAVGKQLDTLGVILGQSRLMTFDLTDGSGRTLDDDNYRILLKAKVAWNHWDGRTKSLYEIWQGLFPGGTIIINDSMLMSAVITIIGTFSQTIIDLINNGLIVPRPEGVLYTYDFGAGPYFGFGYDNVYVSGLDKGKFT